MSRTASMTSQMTVRPKCLTTRFPARHTLFIFQISSMRARVDVVENFFGTVATGFTNTTKLFITKTHFFFLFELLLASLVS